MKHCTICQQDVATVGQVRGCSKCHQTGAAAGMHASLADTDHIEKAIDGANPGALPFVDCAIKHTEEAAAPAAPEPTPAPKQKPVKESVITRVKRAYHRVAAKATKKRVGK